MPQRQQQTPPKRSAEPHATTTHAEARATAGGTAAYRHRFTSRFVADFYRQSSFGLALSSIGIGTYLGETSDADDAAYAAAVRHAIGAGVNVIDTAINYRCQRSERAVGAGLRAAIAAAETTRAEVVVCSKVGYLPLDGAAPATRAEYQEYVDREFIEPGIIRPDDIVAGGHSLAPRFIRYCLAKSRQNLGMRTIDVVYVHNPEQQLGTVEADELHRRLVAAFEVLEEAVARDDVGVYGCATWSGLRVPAGAAEGLSLERLLAAAREAGGENHHFRVIQAPLNLAMSEAVRAQTQIVAGRPVSLLEASRELGVDFVASASLMQGRLAAALPDEVRTHFPNCRTDAQRAATFVRSAPQVTAALVGMKTPRHVDDILSAFGESPA